MSLAVADGDEVAIGDVIGEIETAKSTEEVTSPAAGFVVGLTGAPARRRAGRRPPVLVVERPAIGPRRRPEAPRHRRSRPICASPSLRSNWPARSASTLTPFPRHARHR